MVNETSTRTAKSPDLPQGDLSSIMLVEERRPLLTWLIVMVLGLAFVGALIWMLVEEPGTSVPPPDGTEILSIEGNAHVSGRVSYDRTPPASGDHSPVWLNCGIYEDAPRLENVVHSLEHGAVWIAYDPELAQEDVQGLRVLTQSLYRGEERYVVLSPLPELPAPVVATAWGRQLELPKASDRRLPEFLDQFVAGDQAGEPGSPCSGGTGTPID